MAAALCAASGLTSSYVRRSGHCGDNTQLSFNDCQCASEGLRQSTAKMACKRSSIGVAEGHSWLLSVDVLFVSDVDSGLLCCGKAAWTGACENHGPWSSGCSWQVMPDIIAQRLCFCIGVMLGQGGVLGEYLPWHALACSSGCLLMHVSVDVLGEQRRTSTQ